MAQSLSSAAADAPFSNSAARAETIRDAVRWLAEREAKVKALNAKIREGFAALGIGGSVDWVAAAAATPRQAEPDPVAHAAGRRDGLAGTYDHADQYPQGEPGHADYMLGLADGEAERARVMALGGDGRGTANGAAGDAPKRGRGRPRKHRPEDAGAEA